MSKTTYQNIIVMSTIQCLDDGKRAVFLPSDEPQKVPADAAKTAIAAGIAKKPEPKGERGLEDGKDQANA